MRLLPLRVAAAVRAAADPAGATPGSAEPHSLTSAASPPRPPRAPPPRGARPHRRLRSKRIWRRRAAGYETRGRHMAAPAPNLAGPAESRRPGEAGPGARRPRRAVTHPQTGSPGSRSSGTWTAASWRPPQPRANHMNRGGGGDSCVAIGGGRAGAERHPGAGRAGAAASAPRSRAQPPGTAARPRPQTRPRDRRRRPSLRGPRQLRPAGRGGRSRPRNARRWVGRRFTLKGKRRGAEKPREKSRLKLAAS